jgi:hypothetical protein
MSIEQELLSYQVGYMILWVAFILLFVVVIIDNKFRKKLYKNRIIITRKGTYTFTPHKENETK